MKVGSLSLLTTVHSHLLEWYLYNGLSSHCALPFWEIIFPCNELFDQCPLLSLQSIPLFPFQYSLLSILYSMYFVWILSKEITRIREPREGQWERCCKERKILCCWFWRRNEVTSHNQQMVIEESLESWQNASLVRKTAQLWFTLVFSLGDPFWVS